MKKKWLPLLILTFTLMAFTPQSANAKASTSSFKLNTTYHFDITGDKKTDTIKMTATKEEDRYKNVKITINGKTAYTAFDSYFLMNRSKRIKLSNGKNYIAFVVSEENEDVGGSKILGYKKGKLAVLANIDSLYKVGYHVGIDGVSTSGKTVTVAYSCMSYNLSGIKFKIPYTYKDGKFVQSKTTLKLKTWRKNGKYWTAQKSISVYKAAKKSKKVTTIRKGNKVKIDKIYINKAHTSIYYHVKIKGGKTGWIKGLKTTTGYDKPTQFNEVAYAG